MEARNMKILTESGRRSIADKSFVQGLIGKWGGLLEGVRDPYTKGVLAVLFENEMDHLKSMNEETLSTGVGSFTKYIFPILRRVFPNLLANQIVSVQPMTAPVGGVFTYEYKYADGKGSATSGNNLVQDFQKWYSSEYIDVETLGTPAGGGTSFNAQLDWVPVRALDSSNASTGITISGTHSAGAFTDLVDDGSGVLSSASNANLAGTINYTTGAVTVTCSAGTISAVAMTAAYFYNSEKIGQTTDSKMPSINIDITLSTVTAKSRKLKARWSSEAAGDLRAFHGLDAETELVSGSANQISLELDREIVDDLVQGAAHSASYSHAPTGWHGSGASSELESIRHMITKIDAVSAAIHTSSMRAPANFIVVPPGVAALLGQLTTHGDFVGGASPDQPPSYGPMTSNFGTIRLGTLMNRYVVYQDPFMASNKCLVGLKGSNFLDAGYVYAPYIPLQMSATFQDPDEFINRKAMRTRYATKMLRPEFYGVITVSGLPTVTTV